MNQHSLIDCLVDRATTADHPQDGRQQHEQGRHREAAGRLIIYRNI